MVRSGSMARLGRSLPAQTRRLIHVLDVVLVKKNGAAWLFIGTSKYYGRGVAGAVGGFCLGAEGASSVCLKHLSACLAYRLAR